MSAVGRTEMVAWRSRRLREVHPCSAGVARAVSGAEGGLPPAAGGMDARRLVVLLSRYQERFGAGSAQDRAVETQE